MKMKVLFLLFLVVNSSLNASCPSMCSCASSLSGSDVDCDSRSLGNIPGDLPNDTYKLSIQLNPITDINLQFCKKMPQLLYLYLYKNQISDIPENTFVDCELLHTIYLHYNEISIIEPFIFMNLPSLRIIYLHYNEISTIEPFTFMNLPNLRLIILDNNKIQLLEGMTFINLPNLDQLVPNQDKDIKTFGKNIFIKCTVCEHKIGQCNTDITYLHFNNISRIEPFTFINLPSLRIIYLHNNTIRSLQGMTFINMPNLDQLYLNNNNISNIAEHAFGNLTSLTTLSLSANPLNCNCSIFPFWSWLIERPSIGTSAKCINGTFVTSLQSSELEECKPDNCQCFNDGTCVTKDDGIVVCDCTGHWTGAFCQKSQCTSYDCGYGDCYIEPVNGTAQCLCDDRYINYCPEDDDAECYDEIKNDCNFFFGW